MSERLPSHLFLRHCPQVFLDADQLKQMLSSGSTHWAIRLLNAGMDPIGLCLPPWLFRLLIAIPGLSGDFWKFNKYAAEQLDARMKVQDDSKTDTFTPDITHFLIEHYLNQSDQSTTQTAQLMPLLRADSKLIIVAGSDTTATTLCHLFYHIAVEPGLLRRLQAEVDDLVAKGNKIEHHLIQDAAVVLNGAINETLRLHPPVPSGGFRKTPAEGVVVGGVYVPGDAVVQIPGYAMGRGTFHLSSICHCFAGDMCACELSYWRDVSCMLLGLNSLGNCMFLFLSASTNESCLPDPSLWPSPEAFIPERYTSRPDLMPYPKAFAPFSIGPYSCIGKNLAYMEIRMLAAQIVSAFDVRLADGETGVDLLVGSEDHFTVGLGSVRMCFERRK